LVKLDSIFSLYPWSYEMYCDCCLDEIEPNEPYVAFDARCSVDGATVSNKPCNVEYHLNCLPSNVRIPINPKLRDEIKRGPEAAAKGLASLAIAQSSDNPICEMMFKGGPLDGTILSPRFCGQVAMVTVVTARYVGDQPQMVESTYSLNPFNELKYQGPTKVDQSTDSLVLNCEIERLEARDRTAASVATEFYNMLQRLTTEIESLLDQAGGLGVELETPFDAPELDRLRNAVSSAWSALVDSRGSDRPEQPEYEIG
jgi:hypothetical protein